MELEVTSSYQAQIFGIHDSHTRKEPRMKDLHKILCKRDSPHVRKFFLEAPPKDERDENTDSETLDVEVEMDDYIQTFAKHEVVTLHARKKSKFVGDRVGSRRADLKPTHSSLRERTIKPPSRLRDSLLMPQKLKSSKVTPTRKSCTPRKPRNDKSSPAATEGMTSSGIRHPHFVKQMCHSNVITCFWLGIPANFSRVHLPMDDAVLLLEDLDGKQYETLYLPRKNGLSGGWRRFALDHCLVIGDVLVFELVEPKKFKVHITRSIKKGDYARPPAVLRASNEAVTSAVSAKGRKRGEAFAPEVPFRLLRHKVHELPKQTLMRDDEPPRKKFEGHGEHSKKKPKGGDKHLKTKGGGHSMCDHLSDLMARTVRKVPNTNSSKMCSTPNGRTRCAVVELPVRQKRRRSGGSCLPDEAASGGLGFFADLHEAEVILKANRASQEKRREQTEFYAEAITAIKQRGNNHVPETLTMKTKKAKHGSTKASGYKANFLNEL